MNTATHQNVCRMNTTHGPECLQNKHCPWTGMFAEGTLPMDRNICRETSAERALQTSDNGFVGSATVNESTGPTEILKSLCGVPCLALVVSGEPLCRNHSGILTFLLIHHQVFIHYLRRCRWLRRCSSSSSSCCCCRGGGGGSIVICDSRQK